MNCNLIPKEHRPFGREIKSPIKCMDCDGEMYCISMYCSCEHHKDFDYDKELDGFKFYCKNCNLEYSLPIGKWSKMIKENF